MPRPDRQLPEATLSGSEMARLLAVPDVTRPLGVRDRALREVFYSSALRRSELIALRVVDLDFERGTLFVHRGKGGEGSLCSHWRTGSLLGAALRGNRKTDFRDRGLPRHLVPSSVGTPICADWLCRKVRSYLRQAGINKRGSCHLLRHSVATLLLEGGADIRDVAELLGNTRLKRPSATPGSASSDSKQSTLVATRPPALMWPWLRSCVRCCRRVLEVLNSQSVDRSGTSGVRSRLGCFDSFDRGPQTMAELQLRHPSRRRSRRRRRGGLIK